MGFGVFIGIVLLIILVCLASGVKIVPQSMAFVVERFGSFYATWTTGIHYTVPFMDRIVRRISLKEQVIDFEPQAVITKDNVTMEIDTVVFLQVTNPMLFAYGVEGPMAAIENLTATTLRNVIGDLELDATLTSRDVINTEITATLDVATDRWGIKVNRVELKNILPPREIQEAMEKQMKAERERREQILRAEGEKKSSVLVAEGLKASEILRAEAEKESRILRAEGIREQKIQEALGEAEAIRTTQRAYADSLEMLASVDIPKEVLALKSLETIEKMSDGKATKIIVPSDIQNLSGMALSIKEILSGSGEQNMESKA